MHRDVVGHPATLLLPVIGNRGARRQTASLHEEVVRLVGIVDDLQTKSRAEADAVHLVRESCDLASVVEMATAAMRAKAFAAGVDLPRS